jgi:dTMP kinase
LIFGFYKYLNYKHINSKKISKGKLIVIEGTDGSGKTVQTELLIKRMKKEGCKVKLFDFPRHGKKSCAMVDNYLTGKYGTAEDVGPYCGSIFYAIDRYDAGFEMKKTLSKGINIICNRYVGSNICHQGGKIKDKKKRQEFINWVEDLEYNIFQIPKPDLNIILHMPAKEAQELIKKKSERKYLKNKKEDIHEKNLSHLLEAEKVYLDLAKRKNGFLIECFKNKKLLSIEDIHAQVWKKATLFLT